MVAASASDSHPERPHLDKDCLDESVAPASVRDNRLPAPTEFTAVYDLCTDGEVDMT